MQNMSNEEAVSSNDSFSFAGVFFILYNMRFYKPEKASATAG